MQAVRLCRFALLALASPLASPLVAQDREPGGLRVIVVEGQGAINNVTLRTAREPVVRIEDGDSVPVPDAFVTFTVPMTGPGASFSGQPNTTVITDQNGRAVGRGLRPNGTVGTFEIRVLATYQGRTGRGVITQTNAAPAVTESSSNGGTGLGKKWAIILGAIGGGAAAAIFATRGGGDDGNPSTPPTLFPGVTPGPPTFRPPGQQ